MNTIHHSFYSLVNSGAHHVLNTTIVYSHGNTNRRVIQVRARHGNILSRIRIQPHNQQIATTTEKHDVTRRARLSEQPVGHIISITSHVSKFLNVRPRATNILSKITTHNTMPILQQIIASSGPLRKSISLTFRQPATVCSLTQQLTILIGILHQRYLTHSRLSGTISHAHRIVEKNTRHHLGPRIQATSKLSQPPCFNTLMLTHRNHTPIV